MTLKVVIVGCGKIADGHAEGIKRTHGLGTLVACCDLEPVIAEQFAIRLGVPAHYTDYEKMLSVEKPDVVHIATSPGSHVFLAKKALEAGCHVYVEKPLAPTYEDIVGLIALAEQKKRKLTVGWEFQFDPPVLELKRMIANGELGRIVHVESQYGFDRSGNFGDVLLKDKNHWVHKLPGKLFHDTVDHLLNKSLELLDVEHPRVVANAFTRRTERYGDDRDYEMDELRVVLLGEGQSAYCTFSTEIRPAGQFLRVYGTKSTVHVDYQMRTVVTEAYPRFPSAIGRLIPSFEEGLRYLKEAKKNVRDFAKSEFHYFAGMKTFLTAYYRSILDDTPPPIPYRDIERVAWTAAEIFRQVPQRPEVSQ